MLRWENVVGVGVGEFARVVRLQCRAAELCDSLLKLGPDTGTHKM